MMSASVVRTYGNRHEAPGKRVFRIRDGNGDELKCYGCGWRVTNLYVLATSKSEARRLYMSKDAGLCGDCFSEMLMELPNPETIMGQGETIEV
jgi:hypothetical protein